MTDNIEELKRQHGELLIIDDVCGMQLALRPAKGAELSRFLASVGKDPLRAARTLVADCLVAPEASDFIARLEREQREGTLLPVAGQLSERSGVTLELVAKKA